MNILQVAHCFPPESMTGSEIYAYNLARGLSEKHNLSVFYRINNAEYEEYEIVKSNYNGLTVYKINNKLKRYFSLNNIYINPDIDRAFSGILDVVKPDIVHIHHLLFLSTGIINEIKKRKIPVVFTLHDYWLVCPRGQLIRGNLSICKSPLSGNCFYCLGLTLNIKNIFKKITGFRILFSKRRYSPRDIYEKVDLFIAPSMYLRDKFIKFGLPEEKIIYFDNGVDTSFFKDIQKIKSDKIRFGFIGTLIPSKGAHVIIKAFNMMKDDKAILKIYGKSPYNNGIFDYFYRIRMMARRNKNIKFMGMFDNKDINEVFREIDVLIFSSLWEENSPIVLREAVSAKTCVIASDVGGVSELIKHGENGFLFKAGDFKELFLRMQYAADNLEKIKNNCQNCGKLPNDIKDDCRKMEKIYVEKINNMREK